MKQKFKKVVEWEEINWINFIAYTFIFLVGIFFGIFIISVIKGLGILALISICICALLCLIPQIKKRKVYWVKI